MALNSKNLSRFWYQLACFAHYITSTIHHFCLVSRNARGSNVVAGNFSFSQSEFCRYEYLNGINASSPSTSLASPLDINFVHLFLKFVYGASVFRKLKDRQSKGKVMGIIYKVKWKDCTFTYVRESKWSWHSRSTEHNLALAASKEWAIQHHAVTTTFDMHLPHAYILETAVAYNKTKHCNLCLMEKLHIIELKPLHF